MSQHTAGTTGHRPPAVSFDDLADRVVGRDTVATAQALTHVERRSMGVDRLLSLLYASTGHAQVIGVTGPAGSGKSTLVARLAAAYRASDRRVGILAVDPSSVLSGGAILGDRIRMSDLSGDAGVFIRSLATRGASGGLSRAVLDGLTVLDAAGFDVLIVETVGAGQAEVDVISVAPTVAVVSVPGMGDEVQAIKAGLLEIADIHVINKSDYPGASQTVAEIRQALRLSKRLPGQWDVPIQQTVAASGQGVNELMASLDAHRRWLDTNGGRAVSDRRNAGARIRWAAEDLLRTWLRSGDDVFDAAAAAVARREIDPLCAASKLIAVSAACLPS